MSTTRETLREASDRANEMVIVASLAVLEATASEPQQRQGRFLMGLLSGVRRVLSDALDNYWEPGQAPDDWESMESSRAVLHLAEAVLSDGEKR